MAFGGDNAFLKIHSTGRDAVEAGFQSSALHRKWRNRGGEGAVECVIQEGDRGGADGGTLDGTAGSVRRCFLCEC